MFLRVNQQTHKLLKLVLAEKAKTRVVVILIDQGKLFNDLMFFNVTKP